MRMWIPCLPPNYRGWTGKKLPPVQRLQLARARCLQPVWPVGLLFDFPRIQAPLVRNRHAHHPCQIAGRSAGVHPTPKQTVADGNGVHIDGTSSRPSADVSGGLPHGRSGLENPGRQEFTLKYPNKEVQASLNDSLLKHRGGGCPFRAARSASCTARAGSQRPAALKPAVPRLFCHHPARLVPATAHCAVRGGQHLLQPLWAMGLDIRLEDHQPRAHQWT